MKNNHFTNLEVYQSCRALRKTIHELTLSFPSNEMYRLSDQITRSSRSVTANIAEGFGRYYYKENIAFCRKARGSLYETLDHLIVAYDLKYLSSDELKKYKDEIDSCARLLNGYIRYLKNEKPQKEEKT